MQARRDVVGFLGTRPVRIVSIPLRELVNNESKIVHFDINLLYGVFEDMADMGGHRSHVDDPVVWFKGR